MANPYFQNLPNFAYVNRTKDGRSEGDYSVVVNLFKRAKLRDDIYQNVSFFNKYIVNGDIEHVRGWHGKYRIWVNFIANSCPEQ